ncbi:MAG: hypothetical protein AAGK14_09045 [Verrucomicrobiota bacterium]
MSWRWENRKDLDEILARREELISRSESDREMIAHSAKGLERPISAAVYVYQITTFVRRNPVLVGFGAALTGKVVFGLLSSVFGYEPKRRTKRPGTWLSLLGTWAGGLGTVATIARQLWGYYRRPGPPPPPPPETEEG